MAVDTDYIMEQMAPVAHPASAGVIVATMVGWLPSFAALLSVIWFLICIFESKTFQHWKRNLQMRYRARKLVRLRAAETITVAKIAALEKLRAARVEAREMVAGAKAEAAATAVHETTAAETKIPPV